MPTHTIKVSGVTDELLRLLDARIREQHSTGRAEYIRELIRKDVLTAGTRRRSLDDILAPIQAEAIGRGYEDTEIDGFIEEALAAHRNETTTGHPERNP